MTETVDDQNDRQAPKGRLPDVGGRSEKSVAALLTAPGQLVMLFIVLFPAALAIYLGFTAWTPTSGDDVWHAYRYWYWFDGYWEALNDGTFWAAMWRTVLFMVVSVTAEFADRLRPRDALPQGVPRARSSDALLPAADDGRAGRFGLRVLHDLPGRRAAERGSLTSARPRRDNSLAPESEPRALVGDGRRHLAVDAVDVPDPPFGARGPAGGPDESGPDSRRQFLAPVPLPDPADDEADHPDRADHPVDRGLQGLRRRLPSHPGRARRRLDDDLRLDVPRGDHQLSLGVRLCGGADRPDHRHDRGRLRRTSDRGGTGEHARGARGRRDRIGHSASIPLRRREPDGDGRARTGCGRPRRDAARRTAAIGSSAPPSGRAMARRFCSSCCSTASRSTGP